jgi:hypothetical protein
MAARQDQGLQIALIAFVFLFVVFAAMSYLFYRSSSDAKAHVVELENQKRDSDSKSSKQAADDKDFRQMMGFGEVDNADDVKKTFDEDMKRFGGDPSSGSYRTVLDAVFKAKEETEGRESAAKQQVKELKDSLLAVEAAKEVQVVQYKSEMDKTKEDAAGERNSFEKYRKDLEGAQKQLLANLETQRTTYEGQITEKDAKLKELDDKLGKSEHAKQNLLAEASKSSDTFEVADGRVSLVNQNGTVWINLGSADSLPTTTAKTRFSLATKSTARFGTAAKSSTSRSTGSSTSMATDAATCRWYAIWSTSTAAWSMPTSARTAK